MYQFMNFQIKEIIRQGVEVPEGQNDLRRQQLRELALLNGTLRENDGSRCTNCGATDHKSWAVSKISETIFLSSLPPQLITLMYYASVSLWL